MVHATIADVTARIRERSQPSREAYLARVEAMRNNGPRRGALGCANLAHGFAACAAPEKVDLRTGTVANLAIVTAYNDMLSAHQPYERFPAIIKKAAREAGGVAQVAGGVPAMCDGITQGRPGMELSLFSRDVIAMSAAIALSHDMFDAAVFLGICDKIVPGLVIAAQAFGHLPAVFIPAGPMPSGLPNQEKAKIRQLHAEGKAKREDLLDAEAASYHSPGTCTFYGTANSNQMLMEVMGLHLPGSAFVNPNTPLRDALTAAAAQRALAITAFGNDYTPSCRDPRRARFCEWHRRIARDGRLDQSRHPPRRHGPRGRHCAHARRFRRYLESGSFADTDLSQRHRRCEPFHRRRRHRFSHQILAAGGPPAS